MSKNFVFTVKKDGEIISSIFNFCKEKGIESAWISGIGAAKFAVLLSYDIDKKEYNKKEFQGKFEIANLTGNLGIIDGKPTAHIHIILCNEEMQAFGGHLEQAVVSATCEIIITSLEKQIVRKLNDEIGLNLIED